MTLLRHKLRRRRVGRMKIRDYNIDYFKEMVKQGFSISYPGSVDSFLRTCRERHLTGNDFKRVPWIGASRVGKSVFPETKPFNDLNKDGSPKYTTVALDSSK